MFTLPKLPYAYDALEPYLDAQTLEIHHTKHHQAYIDKLNAALTAHPDLENSPLEELLQNLAQIPETIRGAVKNHGGGHYNHSLFWEGMAPSVTESKPEGELGEALEKKFGSIDVFKKQLSDAAMGVFGSGWVWLVRQPTDGGPAITATPNQDTPLSSGLTPLIGLDLWEHAYYLKYQNRRAEYVENWWYVVNWENVRRRMLDK